MFRRVLFVAFAVVALALSGPTDGFARAGMGGSFGFRGSRSFSLPPATRTAPSPASPLEGYTSRYPSYSPAPPYGGGFFSGSFGRGLLGGFLGAGLFGLLFGNGFFGGLGGGLSLIGLIIQIGLIYLLVRFAIGFFRRQQPVFSGGPSATGGGFGYAPTSTTPLEIRPADYDMFEQRLREVQAAYGAEDVGALRRLATPQMASHFAGELAENARRGIVNRLSDVRLLQGDLAEAWSENGTDFATVAMRYSLIDVNVDRATGRIVSGSPTTPQEVTEVWTFTRPTGAGPAAWQLSAIQQA